MILFILSFLEEYPVGYNFVSLSQGIRSNAMGGAFTAVSDDATGLYYNTAGISLLEGFDSKVALYDLYDQVAILTFGLAFPVKITGFGFSMSIWGDEQQRYNDAGEYTGTFANTEVLSMGAFSIRALKNFSFGIGMKYLFSSFDKYSSTGILWDAGTIYIPNKFLRFGLSLQNLGFPRKFINSYEYPPSRLRSGGAFYFPILDIGRFIYALDIIAYPYRIEIGTGFEVSLYIPQFIKEFVEADISGIRIWGGFNSRGYSLEDHFFYGLGIVYGIAEDLYLSMEALYSTNYYLGDDLRFGLSLYYHKMKKNRKK